MIFGILSADFLLFVNLSDSKKVIKVNDVRIHLQEIKSLIEGIIRTGEQSEQVLDMEHLKKIIKVNDVRVHKYLIKSSI